MADLTARINALAEKVPEVRPDGLRYEQGDWFLFTLVPALPLTEKAAHSLWLASILVWLAGRSTVTLMGPPRSCIWSVRFGAVKSEWKRSATPLEAALSAAEAVAGVELPPTA